MINFQQIFTFVHVARTRSLSGAMAVTHLTQPGVGHHIKSLEKAWKVQLFDRRRHRMDPTPVAQLILPPVEALVRLGGETEEFIRQILERFGEPRTELQDYVDQADEALRNARARLDNQITIGTGAIISLGSVFALIRQAREWMPELTVAVRRISADGVGQALQSGAINLALTDRRLRDPGLRSRRIWIDRIVLIVPPDHPWIARGGVPPAQLVEQPVVVQRHDGGVQQSVDSALAKHRIQFAQFPVAAHVDSPEDAILAVAAGLGTAFVPEAFVQNSSSKSLVRPIDGVQIPREIFLVHPPHEKISPVGRRLEAFLRTPLATKLLAGEG